MQHLKILIFLILFFLSSKIFAQARSFGHLLSRNDYLIDDQRCVVGVEYVGCRIGDSTLVGTSPFLIQGYDLKNIYIRKRISKNEDIVNTIDLGLVDNIHDRKLRDDMDHFTDKDEVYDMSAIMLNLITTFNSPNKKKLNWNNSIYYYPNYRRPFSLRRPDPKVTKLQLNTSLLFENPFSKHVAMISEIGLLQLNGKYPRIHAGASLDFHTENFLFKIGFSITSTISGFFVRPDESTRNDYQQELIETEKGFYTKLDEEKIKDDFALHPELNIQYTF